jgi:tripartite-type tricarboxylate transporter receptor subunit TctC
MHVTRIDQALPYEAPNHFDMRCLRLQGKVFWLGLFAPAKRPRPIVDRLQAAVAGIMAAPDLKERLDKLGAEPFAMPSAQFDQFLVAETAKAQQVVKAAAIKVD